MQQRRQNLAAPSPTLGELEVSKTDVRGCSWFPLPCTSLSQPPARASEEQGSGPASFPGQRQDVQLLILFPTSTLFLQ